MILSETAATSSVKKMNRSPGAFMATNVIASIHGADPHYTRPLQHT